MLIEGHSYDVIHIAGDGRCFFRCAAVFAFPELRPADRKSCGLPVDTDLGRKESQLADVLRTNVVSFLILHTEHLAILCKSFPFLLDINIGETYNGIVDRLARMKCSTEYAGFLEVAALSYLTKNDINIFTKTGDSFHLHTSFAFNNSVTSSPATPLTLLHDIDDAYHAGHFTLLYPTSTPCPAEAIVALAMNGDGLPHTLPVPHCTETFTDAIRRLFFMKGNSMDADVFAQVRPPSNGPTALSLSPQTPVDSNHVITTTPVSSKKCHLGTQLPYAVTAADVSAQSLSSLPETNESTMTSIEVPEQPCHPPVEEIAPQIVLGSTKKVKYTLHFQNSWYEQYPWIHYDVGVHGVLCFTCTKAESLCLAELSKKREPTFITTGFKNWKRAREKFSEHQRSASHRFAAEQLQTACSKLPTIDAQLCQQTHSEQMVARKCLDAIFSSAQFLARQGISFRGHANDAGNFKQLLSLRSKDIPELKMWLRNRVDFTSGTRQNEILEMFSHAIVNKICGEIRKAGMFSIIVDGTQDVSGTEQQSICIRYVNEELKPIEAFLGLYESPDTTGSTIASCVFDVLTRLQLPLTNLRGQTFDGASNMSGAYKGCQAIIGQRQPLYTHCGSHCSNLVAAKVCSLGPLLRNSIQVVQETGAVFSASIKVRTAFIEISQVTDVNVKKIKPLCPTRWLVRVSAIKNILDQYPYVLQTVEK